MPINKSKSTHKLTLFGKSDEGILNNTERNLIRNIVGAALTKEIKDDLKNTISPVSGRIFKGLKPEYALQKARKGGIPIPNLKLKGDMQGKLKKKNTSDGIEHGIFGGKDAKKAFNHNTPKSSQNTSPLRQFIARESESYRTGVLDAVRRKLLRADKRIIDTKLTKKAKALEAVANRLK